jgi:hypothetical protein
MLRKTSAYCLFKDLPVKQVINFAEIRDGNIDYKRLLACMPNGRG